MIKGTLHPTRIEDPRILDFVSNIGADLDMIRNEQPFRFEMDIYGVLCQFSRVDITFEQFVKQMVKSFYEAGYLHALRNMDNAIAHKVEESEQLINFEWEDRHPYSW
jgi:hypothetical protein